MVTVFFDAPQRCVTNLKKLLLQWIVSPETLEHMASTWNHEKSHISPGLKWSRPSGRIRRNKLGYYSGLAVLPNDVVIAWGTGASVGKAKKKKKKAREEKGGSWYQARVAAAEWGFFLFFFDRGVGWLQPMRCCHMDLSFIQGAIRLVLLIVFPYWLSFCVAPLNTLPTSRLPLFSLSRLWWY